MAFSHDLLKDKAILVTGAGKGIGKACALLADACGANVIAVARTESDLVALKNESSERLSFWVGDVQDKALYEKIEEELEYGRLSQKCNSMASRRGKRLWHSFLFFLPSNYYFLIYF